MYELKLERGEIGILEYVIEGILEVPKSYNENDITYVKDALFVLHKNDTKRLGSVLNKIRKIERGF